MNCGNDLKRLKTCGLPSSGDRAGMQWCEGMAKPYHFEILQSLDDVILDLMLLILPAMGVESSARKGDEKMYE